MDFLITPAGSLFFHLNLTLILGVFLVVAQIYQDPEGTEARFRWSMSFTALFSLRALAAVLAGLIIADLLPSDNPLPAFERYLSLAGGVALGWPILFPRSHRAGDRSFLALQSAAFLGFLTTLLFQLFLDQTTPFNNTLPHLIWTLSSLLVFTLTALLLLIRKPDQWQIISLAFLGLILGDTLQLWLGQADSRYPALVRIAEMLSYPLLTAAALRTVTLPIHLQPDPRKGAYSSQYALQNLDQAMSRVAQLLSTEEDQALAKGFVEAIARLLRSEYAYLFTVPGPTGDFTLAYGFDLIQEAHLPGKSLHRSHYPRLADCLERGQPLTLSVPGLTPDLQRLHADLGISHHGPLLFQPLEAEGENLGGLLLLSPYSRGEWSELEGSIVSNLAHHVAQRFVTIRKHAIAGLPRSPQPEMESEYGELQRLLDELEQENRKLREAVLRAGGRWVDTETGGLAGWEAGELGEDFFDLPGWLPVEGDLTQEAALSIPHTSRNEEDLDPDTIAAIAGEMRQPMSAVLGYTELLLGESVGLLGAMQRKFLDRIRGGILRTETLLQDLLQMSTSEQRKVHRPAEPVDLLASLESALDKVRTSIKDHGTTIGLTVPPDNPMISGDADSLTRALFHLLHNAVEATPDGGRVEIVTDVRENDGGEFIAISITDEGGGIPMEYLSNIFDPRELPSARARRGGRTYGIGLSMVKAICDTWGWRVWAETRAGEGSTFTLLLPVLQTEPIGDRLPAGS